MLNRNTILELIDEGSGICDSWIQLRFYIEHNSDIKIPNRKERKMSIGSWVKKNIDQITPF